MKKFIITVVLLGLVAAVFTGCTDMDKVNEALESVVSTAKAVISDSNSKVVPESSTTQPTSATSDSSPASTSTSSEIPATSSSPTPTSSTTTSSDPAPSSGEDTVDEPEPESGPAGSNQLNWATYKLHDAGGRFGTVAIDSNDKVHIAHSGYSNSNSVLLHTTNAGGPWVDEIIEFTGVAESVSIAIDSNDGIHISYYATDGQYDLKYAYKATTSSPWVKTTIDTSGTVGQYNSIAVDSVNSRVHIVYGDLDNGSLKYATNTIGATGNWITETIENGITGQVHSSIVVDSNGTCYIAYQAQTSTLKYVTGSLNSWATPVTLDSGGVVSDTSIALDSSNNVHISYYLGGLTTIKYATNSGGSWSVRELTDSYSGTKGKHTSIAIDSNDNIHISYYKESSTYSALKIVQNINGTWSDHTIDEDGDDDGTGKYSSIAIDSRGRLHISYYRNNGSDLRYAVQE